MIDEKKPQKIFGFEKWFLAKPQFKLIEVIFKFYCLFKITPNW